MARVMKNSGIAWIGRIPSTWATKKIGGLYFVRNEKVSDKVFMPLSVTMKGIVPQLETAAKTNDGDNRKLVRKGDFAINSRSDRRGSCGISSYDGSVSLINTVLTPRIEMNPQYYDWLFHTIQFSDEFYKWGHGIVDDLWTTGWQEMKRIFIPVPSLIEQEQIASYLNSKCTELDSLSSDIQKEIETLEAYRKSLITEAVTRGIRNHKSYYESHSMWFHKIPAPWTIQRLKYVCSKITDGSHFSPPIVDEGYPYITAKDVHGEGIEYSTACKISEKDYMQLVANGCKPNVGDVLVVKDGATTGRVGRVIDTEPCVILSSVAMLTPNLNIVGSKYLQYCMESDQMQSQIKLSMAGSAMPRTTLDKINEYAIAVAPLAEQMEIVKFLDSKCSEIDSLISAKKQQLVTLASYKKSLIYEYVTGKKEVPFL